MRHQTKCRSTLTTSTRRSTDPKPPKGYYLDTSTHDLHTEVDGSRADRLWQAKYFNSRPPHGGRLPGATNDVMSKYFNSRPPHGGRPHSRHGKKEGRHTSTHDLHTEVDRKLISMELTNMHFNSRPPHGGRRRRKQMKIAFAVYFNSRPPHGGRQKYGYQAVNWIVDFNSRPPHGGRPAVSEDGELSWTLQLTTSTRRSTKISECINTGNKTSTHDLHTEVDFIQFGHTSWFLNFNSRPPHGGRQYSHIILLPLFHFNSRPPHGGRRPVTTAIRGVLILQLTTSTHCYTGRMGADQRGTYTSTHDLHTEVDLSKYVHLLNAKDFNSRPPHGGRRFFNREEKLWKLLQLTTSTRRSTIIISSSLFWVQTSTHDLHTEVDYWCPIVYNIIITSTHDLHTEVDEADYAIANLPQYFNSRPPHGGRQ